ncbi:MAG: amino acid--tRNA ligase-related protein [Candidatus Micrarchaeia archaeon]
MSEGVKRQLARLGTKDIAAVARVEGALVKGARKYFDENGFTEVFVPHLTRATGSCENIDTLFEVDYFGERAFLCQTGQLYLESLIPVLSRVYAVGPSFRAEEAVDGRHLCEFPLLEIEFSGDFDELMAHIEGTICSMVATAVKEQQQALEFLGANVKELKSLNAPFKKLPYRDAVDILGLPFGADLKSSHEAALVKEFGGKPLFVTHYPREIKFFNMRTNESDAAVVNSADLLLPFGGEAVGSAEREWEAAVLYEKLSNSAMLKQLERRGGSIKDFEWYVQHLRDKGSVPHAGCGIGLNRVTQFVLGKADIRDCTAFPLNRETLL